MGWALPRRQRESLSPRVFTTMCLQFDRRLAEPTHNNNNDSNNNNNKDNGTNQREAFPTDASVEAGSSLH